MTSQRELKLAGILLFLSTLIILVTIYFEYQAGWLELQNNPQADKAAFANFMHENWPTMKSIWTWQNYGHILAALSYMLFLKNTRILKGIPLSFFWAINLLGSILVIVAFYITLGGYYEALTVYGETPVLFDTVRATVLSIYRGFPFGILALIALVILESYSNHGVIPQIAGTTTLVILALALLAIITGLLPRNVGMIPYLLIPALVGFCYWRFSEKSAQVNNMVQTK